MGGVMSMRMLAVAAAAAILGSAQIAIAQTGPLPPPSFHHLMLNTVDPDAAIAFYTKAFPDTKRTEWGGYPAISSPDNVLILFNKVASAAGVRPAGHRFLAFRLEPAGPAPESGDTSGGRLQIRAALDRHRGRFGDRQQRHLSRRRRGLRLGRDQRADGGSAGQRRQARRRSGLRLSDRTGPCADRGSRKERPGTLQPCSYVGRRAFCAQLWYQEHLNATVPSRRTPAHRSIPKPIARSRAAYPPGLR